MINSGVYVLFALIVYISIITIATNFINKEFFELKKNKIRLKNNLISRDEFESRLRQSFKMHSNKKRISLQIMLVTLIIHAGMEEFNGSLSYYIYITPFILMTFSLIGLFWLKGRATLSAVKNSAGIFPWM